MHDWNNGESSAAGETRLKRLCTSLPPRMASGVQWYVQPLRFWGKGNHVSQDNHSHIAHTHGNDARYFFLSFVCPEIWVTLRIIFLNACIVTWEYRVSQQKNYNSDFDSWNWRRIYTCITCFGVASVASRASTALAAFKVSTHCLFSDEFLSKLVGTPGMSTRQTVLFWVPQILSWQRNAQPWYGSQCRPQKFLVVRLMSVHLSRTSTTQKVMTQTQPFYLYFHAASTFLSVGILTDSNCRGVHPQIWRVGRTLGVALRPVLMGTL